MNSSVGMIIPNIWKNHVPNHQPDILRWLDMIGDQHIADLNVAMI